jgi:ADP-heptose:LPS heptosyltransferase
VDRHEVEFSLSFAHRVGAVPGEARFPLEIAAPERDDARRWLEARGIDAPFVVLHPGSGGSCPRWPSRHFAALARRLRGEGWPVVLSVGPEDGAIARDFGDDRAVFSGDLPTLGALLAAAALVVGNSTGPLHLAAALGTPTLALHVSWSSCGAARWGPYSPTGWALVVGGPELSRLPRRRRDDLGAAALAELAPEGVFGYVRAILDRGGQRLA